MFSASSVYHDPATLELVTPYNVDFVHTIKAQIPASHRRWNSDRKTWIVLVPYDTTALSILRLYFPTADVGAKPAERPIFMHYDECRCDADHRALYICQDAPLDVVKAVYRVLAKSTHPDAGGDHERMQELNGAYARLTEGARS